MCTATTHPLQDNDREGLSLPIIMQQRRRLAPPARARCSAGYRRSMQRLQGYPSPQGVSIDRVAPPARARCCAGYRRSMQRARQGAVTLHGPPVSIGARARRRDPRHGAAWAIRRARVPSARGRHDAPPPGSRDKKCMRSRAATIALRRYRAAHISPAHPHARATMRAGADRHGLRSRPSYRGRLPSSAQRSAQSRGSAPSGRFIARAPYWAQR